MKKPIKTNLGPLKSIFRGRKLCWFDIFFVFIPGAVAVLAPLVYGMERNKYGYAHFGPVAAHSWSRPWFFLTVIATLSLLFLGILRIYKSLITIRLHKYGLVIRKSPLKSVSLLWSNFTAVTSTSILERFLIFPLRSHFRITLFLKERSPVYLNGHFQNKNALLVQIKKHFYPHIYPNLREQLRKNKWIHFGLFSFNQKNIRIFDEEIPWHKVSDIKIKSGFMLFCLDNNKTFRLATDQIANIDIGIKLIREEINI